MIKKVQETHQLKKKLGLNFTFPTSSRESFLAKSNSKSRDLREADKINSIIWKVFILYE